VSAIDVCTMLVGSCLHCRCASAICFVNHWWHLTSSTLISVWPCCMPGPWSTSTMLCIWWWIPRKAERPAGEDRRVALSTTGSTRFRRIPTLYCYLRCGDLRSPWVTERRSGRATWNTRRWWRRWWRLVSKMEGKTNFSRHRQAVQNLDCWMFENHWQGVIWNSLM